MDIDQLQSVIRAGGPLAGVVYFILQLLTVIFAPIPSNVTMAAGALALGFLPALILGVLAVIAGSVLLFLLARRLGRKAVLRFLDRGVMDKYLPVIEEKQEMFLFLTMLFPLCPDDVLCILAGLTGIPFAHFLVIMVLGRPWGLVFAALLGGGMLELPVWGWAALIVGMAVVFFFALRYSHEIEERLFALAKRLTDRIPKRVKSDDHARAVPESGD